MKTNKSQIILMILLFVLCGMTLEKIGLYHSKTSVPVLLYHHILKDSENVLFQENASVTSYENFKEQMAFLYENGFKTITTEELYNFIYNKKELPPKSFMLTFDDGYYSNYYYAYPILKKYHYTACVFLITERTQKDGSVFDPDRLTKFDRRTIEATKDVFEFGSHTYNLHERVDGKSLLLTYSNAQIIDDLKKSLETVSNKVVFAYPYGEYSNRIIYVLKKMKFKLAFTIEKGYVTKTTDPYRLNRFIVFPTTNMEDFKKIFLSIGNEY